MGVLSMRAVYDLARCLPSFDVVTFLLHTERERIERGQETLEIDIIPGPKEGFHPGNLWPFDVDGRRAMMANVVRPMCELLPSVVRVTNWPTRPAECVGAFGYGSWSIELSNFIKAYSAGIRPLRLPRDAARDEKLVTFTLREAEHWPTRNSNVMQWIKAADILGSRGYRVVFIRDTRLAYHGIDCFATAPGASVDLNERAFLYRSAFCNLGVSNGPMWFALALDAPVIMLRPTTQDAGRCATREYFQRCGVNPGQQLPGAPIHQRLCWEDDTAENIVRAFEDWSHEDRRDVSKLQLHPAPCTDDRVQGGANV